MTTRRQSSIPEGMSEQALRLRRWLSEQDVEHRIISHRGTFTALDDARAAHVAPAHAAKTIVLRDGAEYCLAVIPASKRLDIHKLRRLLDRTGSLRLASEAEIVARFPDCEAGAVPPLGPDAPVLELLDYRLLGFDRLLCSGGDHRHGVLLPAEALAKAAGLRVGDICED